MASGNHWGKYFRISTFGESHGPALGVVIDGCPSGLELNEADIQVWLNRRRPGTRALVSPRQEPDEVRILSGVYQGKTTGAPIALTVENRDANSKAYSQSAQVLRPGYSSFTYWNKWGHYDPRGGGRSSARETVSRVCAGAVASKILAIRNISIIAFVRQIGPIKAMSLSNKLKQEDVESSLVRCPDPQASEKMQKYLEELAEAGDSIGGVVEAWIDGVCIGLGAPVFDRFDARLAQAMMSLPASRAFSMDDGFEAALHRGSEFNDSFALTEQGIIPTSNHASGIMGGITTGQRVRMQVAFKPASSIRKPQMTCDTSGHEVNLDWKQGFRHDPCVAIRACPVVEAMAALVCLDFIMERHSDRLDNFHL